MQRNDPTDKIGKLFPKRGWVGSITVNSVGLWLVDLFGFLKRVLRLLLVDTIAHAELFKKIAERVNDGDVMWLLKLIVKASGKQGIGQGSLCKALHKVRLTWRVMETW